MQTFLPYPSFFESAKSLDNKRLGKQRVECLQILQTLAKGEYSCGICGDSWEKCCNMPMWCTQKKIKTPWYNHPAVQMWKGYEVHLCDYLFQICYEWRDVRGYKDTVKNKAISLLSWCCVVSDQNKFPEWLGKKEFHLSHQSNLIRKKPDYYRPIFGYNIPDNLPYFWPTRQ